MKDKLPIRMDKLREPDQNAIPSTAPRYILRGHKEPIHALRMFAQNLRLVSGDSDGYVIVWDMVTKRPVVSWKPHNGAILEVKAFQFELEAVVFT